MTAIKPMFTISQLRTQLGFIAEYNEGLVRAALLFDPFLRLAGVPDIHTFQLSRQTMSRVTMDLYRGKTYRQERSGCHTSRVLVM